MLPQNAVEVILIVLECVRINMCEVICVVIYPTCDNILTMYKVNGNTKKILQSRFKTFAIFV